MHELIEAVRAPVRWWHLSKQKRYNEGWLQAQQTHNWQATEIVLGWQQIPDNPGFADGMIRQALIETSGSGDLRDQLMNHYNRLPSPNKRFNRKREQQINELLTRVNIEAKSKGRVDFVSGHIAEMKCVLEEYDMDSSWLPVPKGENILVYALVHPERLRYIYDRLFSYIGLSFAEQRLKQPTGRNRTKQSDREGGLKSIRLALSRDEGLPRRRH